MEPFESNGDWWVPGTSERVSGKVDFEPTEGVLLELNGPLPSRTDDQEELSRRELSKRIPLLYGDLGREGPVTVQNATITSASFGGHQAEEYLAKQMFIGEHLPESPSFERADFLIDELPDWSNSSTVRPVLDTESVEEAVDFEEIEAAYAATSSEDYSAEFDNIDVQISNYCSVSTSINSVELETTGVLKIFPDGEVPLNTIFEYGNRTLEYLSFAIGTGIYPDEFRVYTDVNDRPLDGYYTILDYTKNRPSSKADYLFHPGWTDFETTLKNWITLCEDAPEVHRNYRQLIHRSNLSPQLKFLTCVIALEALYDSESEDETYIPEEDFEEIHSEIMELVPEDSDLHGQMYGLLDNVANTLSIKDKLLRLMQSEEELVKKFFDISELASEARKQRNKVAHGSSELSLLEYNVLSMKLQLLLEALLARRIGVPGDDLPDTLASRYQGSVPHKSASANWR